MTGKNPLEPRTERHRDTYPSDVKRQDVLPIYRHNLHRISLRPVFRVFYVRHYGYQQ